MTGPSTSTTVSASDYWTVDGGTMGDGSRKSRYSLAFMGALCAQAGIRMQETRQDEDVDAVDMSVEYPEAPVRVQLKCSSTKTMHGDYETIDLRDHWITSWKTSGIPVFLVLVVVDPSCRDWIEEQPVQTLHRAHAYWAQFDPSSIRKSVRIYSANRVTVGTLLEWRNITRAAFGQGRVGV